MKRFVLTVAFLLAPVALRAATLDINVVNGNLFIEAIQNQTGNVSISTVSLSSANVLIFGGTELNGEVTDFYVSSAPADSYIMFRATPSVVTDLGEGRFATNEMIFCMYLSTEATGTHFTFVRALPSINGMTFRLSSPLIKSATIFYRKKESD